MSLVSLRKQAKMSFAYVSLNKEVDELDESQKTSINEFRLCEL